MRPDEAIRDAWAHGDPRARADDCEPACGRCHILLQAGVVGSLQLGRGAVSTTSDLCRSRHRHFREASRCTAVAVKSKRHRHTIREGGGAGARDGTASHQHSAIPHHHVSDEFGAGD